MSHAVTHIRFHSRRSRRELAGRLGAVAANSWPAPGFCGHVAPASLPAGPGQSDARQSGSGLPGREQGGPGPGREKLCRRSTFRCKSARLRAIRPRVFQLSHPPSCRILLHSLLNSSGKENNCLSRSSLTRLANKSRPSLPATQQARTICRSSWSSSAICRSRKRCGSCRSKAASRSCPPRRPATTRSACICATCGHRLRFRRWPRPMG